MRVLALHWLQIIGQENVLTRDHKTKVDEKNIKSSILIVGAGPVGLGMAIDLAWRGVPCTLLDKGDGIVRMSKMGLVSVSSMEFCRRWGISEEVRQCGFPADFPLNQVFCTNLNGHHIATIEYPCIADEPTHGFSPEKKQRCPQLWFDPILAQKAKKSELIDLQYQKELISFTQNDDGISAIVKGTQDEGLHEVHAEYLIACDGAGSNIRKASHIDLEGDAALSYSVGIYFTAPDLINHHKMGPAERYMLIGEEGTWGHLTVVDSRNIWRLTVLGNQEKMESESFDADYWIHRCFGSNSVPYKIDAVMPWRRSRLVANRYQAGRVFLAGDACHVMAPNGGYGMNTGLGDVVNLSWKLEAVLKGWANPKLLNSYEIERRPIAVRNTNAAATNFASMAPVLSYSKVETDSAEGLATRNRLQTDLVIGTKPEWEVHGITLGYRYEGSPIICQDGTVEPADDMSQYIPTTRPGHRAPHLALSNGESTLDLFGHGFVLFQIEDGPEKGIEDILISTFKDTADVKGIPLRCFKLSGSIAIKTYERRFVLVRPDGHVAWRGEKLHANPEQLWEQVCGWRE